MRELQARMLAAVLDGDGLEGVAELAAAEAGRPVAILLPARGLAATAPNGAEGEVDLELPVHAGDERIGAVVAFAPNGGGNNAKPKVDLEEVLRAAAVAALAEVAATDARDRLAEDLRGSLLEDLRGGRIEPDETVRRAARLGCDLSKGAVVLVAHVRPSKLRMSAALITGEWSGAIAEPADDDRVYALLPPRDTEDPANDTVAGARTIASRLSPHGLTGFSSFCAEPADLVRATSEAELMLDVITRDERLGEQLADGIGGGVYRLLLRALASNPEEVTRFYDDTVAPLVAHDREYKTDLLGTLEAYLANDCNMNATARAVFAHRHTVAHRLERARELTGLDPSAGEDRERLGLGIKAYRLLAPTLRR